MLCSQNHLEEYRAEATLMGTDFGFTIVDTANSARAGAILELCIEEVQRIERLISEWIDTTAVSRLNALAGIRPMQVPSELYDLTNRALRISAITQGAFDITFHGMSDLWKFERQEEARLPDPALVSAYLRAVGHEKVILQHQTIFLSQPGMSIGYGAIGKGYAADKVKSMLEFLGINNGVINASGDVTAWGHAVDGSDWKVGIANPDMSEDALMWLPVTDRSVATSGNYERYFMHADTRYAHILNPLTGYPVTGLKSVSVVHPSGELADAFATAVFVMGVEAGLHFIEQLPNTECLIIDDKNALHLSSGIDFTPDK